MFHIGGKNKITVPKKTLSKVIKKIEDSYEEMSPYQKIEIYDTNSLDEQGLQYYIHRSILSKLKSFDVPTSVFTSEEFADPIEHLSLMNIFKSNKYKNIKKITKKTCRNELEKMYVLFQCIYPYYLAKYAFDSQSNKHIFVGPFVLKNGKTLNMESNYNTRGMLTIGIETEIYEKQEVVQEDEKEGGSIASIGKEFMKQQAKKQGIDQSSMVSMVDQMKEKAQQQGFDPSSMGSMVDQMKDAAQQQEFNPSSMGSMVDQMKDAAQQQGFNPSSMGSTSNEQMNQSKVENVTILPTETLQEQQPQSNSGIMNDFKEKTTKEFIDLKEEIKELKQSVLKQDTSDEPNRNNEINGVHEKIDALEQMVLGKQNSELSESMKRLYMIFSIDSFQKWIKNKNHIIIVCGFLKSDHDTRIRIIQGTFFNEPVKESLDPYFAKGTNNDPAPTPKESLQLKQFFGISNKIPKLFIENVQKNIKEATKKKSLFQRAFGKKKKKTGGNTNKRIQFSVKNKSQKKEHSLFQSIHKKKKYTRNMNHRCKSSAWRKTKKNT